MENNEITVADSIMGAVNSEPTEAQTEAITNLNSALTTNGGLTAEQLQQLQAQYRKTKPLVRNYEKISRNVLCPCGSGKKYKDCCMNSGKYDGYTERGTKKNPYETKEEAA